jgi:hypothetical protein
MSKFIKYIILAFLFLLTIFIYKNWQRSKLGISKPILQTTNDLLNETKAFKIPGYIAVSKDTNSYNFLHTYFDVGNIFIFNNKKELIINNIISDDGICYSDINKGICNGFNFNKNVKGIYSNKGLLDSTLLNSNFINGKIKSLDSYKYVIIYGWAKYLKASYNDETLNFKKCIDTNKVLVIAFNNDMVDTWYFK